MYSDTLRLNALLSMTGSHGDNVSEYVDLKLALEFLLQSGRYNLKNAQIFTDWEYRFPGVYVNRLLIRSGNYTIYIEVVDDDGQPKYWWSLYRLLEEVAGSTDPNSKFHLVDKVESILENVCHAIDYS